MKLGDMKAKARAGVMSAEEIKARIKKQKADQSKRPQTKPSSNIGIHGDENTCKTAFAVNCRTDEEILNNKKIYIIDYDNNARSTVETFFKSEMDKNIFLFDKLKIINEKGHEDDLASEDNLRAHIKAIIDIVNEDPDDVKAVIFDGLDSWLKTCENIMRKHELKLDPGKKPKYFDWQYRNKRYHGLMMAFFQIPCDLKFVIAHDKEKKELVNDQLLPTGMIPDWEKKTPGMLSQIILMERKIEGVTTTMKWTVEKSKVNPYMLNEKGEIMKIVGKKMIWNDPAETIEKLRDTSHVKQRKGKKRHADNQKSTVEQKVIQTTTEKASEQNTPKNTKQGITL